MIAIIRFAILAVVNKPWIWSLLADPLYFLETGNLISLMFICLAIVGICENYIIVYFEAKMNSVIVTFLQKIKNNQSKYKLQYRYYDEFCRKSKFMIRWFLGPFFKVIIFVPSLTMIFLSIKAYLDPDMNFSITVM